MSFVPKDQNVNLWVGSWAVSLASLSAPIAHAKLNRASLTCCTQLDTCLVACIQLDTIISYPAVFQCPTFHAPLLIWIYIFFLKSNIARQFLSKNQHTMLLTWFFDICTRRTIRIDNMTSILKEHPGNLSGFSESQLFYFSHMNFLVFQAVGLLRPLTFARIEIITKLY